MWACQIARQSVSSQNNQWIGPFFVVNFHDRALWKCLRSLLIQPLIQWLDNKSNQFFSMLSVYILHESRTTVQSETGYSKFCKLGYSVGPQEWVAAQQPIHQSVSDPVDNIVPPTSPKYVVLLCRWNLFMVGTQWNFPFVSVCVCVCVHLLSTNILPTKDLTYTP